MLDPKPPELLTPGRKFIKEGPIYFYNPKDKRKKPRYFFLFNDCLLVAKRERQTKFWLRFFVSLKSGLKVEDVLDSVHNPPDVEFRIYAPKKTLICFAQTPRAKLEWLDAIHRCISGIEGRRNAGNNPEEIPLPEDLPFVISSYDSPDSTFDRRSSPEPTSAHHKPLPSPQTYNQTQNFGLPPGATVSSSSMQQPQPIYVFAQPGQQPGAPIVLPAGAFQGAGPHQSYVLQPINAQGLPPGSIILQSPVLPGQGFPPGAVLMSAPHQQQQQQQYVQTIPVQYQQQPQEFEGQQYHKTN